MRRLNRFRPAFVLIASLAAAFPAVAAADGPRLLSEDYVQPGEVLTVTVPSSTARDGRVSLVDASNRTVSQAEAFPWTSPSGERAQVALLGVPPTAEPGPYRLSFAAVDGPASLYLEKRMQVSPRDFEEEVIPLDAEMGSLYQDDSERKQEEARHLWAVLAAFDPSAQWHSGPLALPFEDPVPTAHYGDRRRYRMPDGTESTSIHFGGDLWAAPGTPIHAAGAGRVVLARERMVTGNTVVLEHMPGVFTLYYHMDSLAVSEGDMVDTGDVLGYLGSTGLVTGPHLHWEMRAGTVPVDAMAYLDRPLLDTTALAGMMDGTLREGR